MLSLAPDICPLSPSWLFKAMLNFWVSRSPFFFAWVICSLTTLRLPFSLIKLSFALAIAVWIFFILLYSVDMAKANSCWINTCEFNFLVRLSMSTYNFCLFIEPCLIIYSKFPIVWPIYVCWLKRYVMFRSYWVKFLTP